MLLSSSSSFDDDFEEERVELFDFVDELDFRGTSFLRSVVVVRRLFVVDEDRLERDGVAVARSRVVLDRSVVDCRLDGMTRRLLDSTAVRPRRDVSVTRYCGSRASSCRAPRRVLDVE